MSNVFNAAAVEAMAAQYGLSLRELCERANVSLTAFYRWRGGHGDITLETYDRLMSALRQAKTEGLPPKPARGLCRKGHEYGLTSTGRRVCHVCRNEAHARWRSQNTQKLAEWKARYRAKQKEDTNG